MIFLVIAFTAGMTASAPGQSADGRSVEIQVGDNMRFTPSVIETHAGERLRVLLHGTGRIANLTHNFVLLKKGIAPKAFVDKAAPATKETGAIDPAIAEQVITASRLVRSGGTVEAGFDAPTQPGEYTFVCTFPGHFNLGMKGQLVVR